MLEATLAGTLVDVPRHTRRDLAEHVGVGASGDSLTKTAPPAWGNAGASSTRGIPSAATATPSSPSPPIPGYAMFGLGNGDSDQGYTDIDYAFYTYPGTGQLMVYENGVYRGQFGAYAPATSCASRSSRAS